jgi:DNA-binding transcriptional MerR regulator
MLEPSNNDELPAIPGKRYFTIGEVSELCAVKPHVLRYWEQEFPQLKPVKRRGNRRYYQRQDVLVIRQIRALLYEQGFTIGGARNRLEGEEAREDVTQTQQIVRQMRTELEELLKTRNQLDEALKECGFQPGHADTASETDYLTVPIELLAARDGSASHAG